jgi:flagella basal body P-ring formation protein FlgA
MITGQFAALRRDLADYSARMLHATTAPAKHVCRRALRRTARVAALTAMATAMAGAGAQAAPPADTGSGLDSALEKQVRQLAMDGTHASAAGAPRVEISVGQLDARLRLAPCQRVEPYLPEGVRLWGKSRIGLRCAQGAVKWNVYLPVTVKVFGMALVATGGLAAGSVLASTDVAQAEVDLAEDASAAVHDVDLAVGRSVARALKPGQSLRQSHLKARQWFSAGETVTVVAQGNGFSVSGEAEALNNGIEGQPVRVRTESGRVLTGAAAGERRVELGL